MRIAYIGNFTRPWCTEVHVAAALTELGHSVVRLQENRSVLDQQAKTLLATPDRPGRPQVGRPDLFMWTRTWGVDVHQAERMLNLLRREGVPIVSFHLDRFMGLEREPLIDQEPFFRTDRLFTPDSGDWAAHGVNAYWMPPGVDGPEANKVYAPNPKRWPWKVALVGSYPYPHPDWQPVRTRVVKHLRARYGGDFAVLPYDIGGRPIRNADLGELYATVPVLVGDSCWPGLEEPIMYWSDRVPETLGRGGFLIHPHCAKLAALYPDLATYPLGDLDALDYRIDSALEYPELRHAVSGANRRLVLERDTYTHRMAELVAVATSGVEVPPPMSHSAPPEAPRVTETAATGRVVQTAISGPVTPSGPLGAAVTGTWGELSYTFTVPPGDENRLAVAEVWDNDDYRMADLELTGATVIDVGGHVGAFTVLAAMLGAARVETYEPHPDTFKLLEANVSGSPAAGKVVCHQAAVGGWAREDELVGDGGGAHFAREVGSGTEIAVLDVDSVLAGTSGDVVLKLDCEGAEYEIIECLSDWSRVRLVVMEWHGPGMPHLSHLDEARWGPMVSRLADHGQVLTVGHPGRGGLLWMRRY